MSTPSTNPLLTFLQSFTGGSVASLAPAAALATSALPPAPAIPDNPVATDLIRPHVAAALPGWLLVHGSMDQINETLDGVEGESGVYTDGLPVGARVVIVNDVISFELDNKSSGATDVTFNTLLAFVIKSDVADSADVRISYTREAMRAARALINQIHRKGDGLKVGQKASGRCFINGYDANLDGLDLNVRLTAPADSFDYCAAPVPYVAGAPAGPAI